MTGDNILCTDRHRKVMESEELTDLNAWKECIRETSAPRFDKRTGTSIPMGVFVGAVDLMNRWRPGRFVQMSNERGIAKEGEDVT